MPQYLLNNNIYLLLFLFVQYQKVINFEQYKFESRRLIRCGFNICHSNVICYLSTVYNCITALQENDDVIVINIFYVPIFSKERAWATAKTYINSS